jgi:hypothetical protein
LTPRAHGRKQKSDGTHHDRARRTTTRSFGATIANLSVVKAAKKANAMSRVHRRLIDPIY